MVKIAVIGWYGTETIGDRAIFAGLLSVLSEAFNNGFEVYLGSIYPFFSKRTLLEDQEFYHLCTGNKDINIIIFDSQNKNELDRAIKECDILAMGGGPLMGFPSMFMVEYAFAKAYKIGKKTMILGCGIGPMIKKIYEKSLINIVSKSNVTIFRDEKSVNEYQILSGKEKGISIIDPAIFASDIFKKNNLGIPKKEDLVVVCIREFPNEYKINHKISSKEINQRLKIFISNYQQQTSKNLELIPMHYFEIGGDDRKYLNEICFDLENENITVQNVPLNLYQTLYKFTEAQTCIGMRFHSVVLQTLLNGNNIILDYTDPQKGKIGNFLKQIEAVSFYKDSSINLQSEDLTKKPPLVPSCKFMLNEDFINQSRKEYIKQIIG